VPNELKNAEVLTVQLTMKSIIHHAKHTGLLCTISALWTVADVYSADSV